MKRIIFILAVVLCIHVSVRFDAEADNVTINQLITQVNDPSVPIKSKTLEAIALVTYEVLVNVPFVGVQDSQADIESLIALRMTLETHTGVLERLLALRIQEGIDRTLLFELARRSMDLLGESVSPPYQADSLQLETVTALLQANSIAEREQIRYIRTLNGQLAAFCRSKNFSIEDFLDGDMIAGIPRAMGFSIRRMSSIPGVISEEANREDVVFGTSLIAIDQARDIRLVYDLFFNFSPDSYHEQVNQRLLLYPKIRITSGLYTTSDDVNTTIEKYLGNGKANHYLRMVTWLFSAYFTHPETVAAKFDKIFFLYTGEHEGFTKFW